MACRRSAAIRPSRLYRLARLAYALLLMALVSLSGLVIAAGLAPLPPRLAVGDSPVVAWRDGEPAHVFLAADERWRLGVAPEAVDPGYRAALIRLEDRRFWWHPGVDVIAVARSAWVNLRRGEVVTGASTLTMQLVRLLEPRPRTMRSKMIEAFRAAQLELRLPKRVILFHYLRFLPFGRNLEGVEAAAWSYFGHGAAALSPAEVATLLAVPQGPSTRAPHRDHRARLGAARDQIAAWLLARDRLPGAGEPRAILAAVRATPVPTVIGPLPRAVPHAATWLRARHPERSRVVTTLDPKIQVAAESALVQAGHPLFASGVDHAAAVVADRRTGEIRALVGNPDFGAPRAGAQIASFAVPRPWGLDLARAFGRVEGRALDLAAAVVAHGGPGALRLAEEVRWPAPAGALPPLTGAVEARRLLATVPGRDAWAAGVGPAFAAVVWVGNLDHRPSPSLHGPVAAPILEAILTATRAVGTSRPVFRRRPGP